MGGFACGLTLSVQNLPHGSNAVLAEQLGIATWLTRSYLVIVDVVGRGNGTNFSESLVTQKFAVLENNLKSIGGREGLTVDDFDGDEFFAVVHEVEAATFASFAWIGYRILADVVPFAIAIDGRTFQRKFQGVAIHLL